MHTQQQLTTLKSRIRKGESETERWRMTGPAEKYLESFCNVESLERQLDDMLREGDAATLAPALSPTGEP